MMVPDQEGPILSMVVAAAENRVIGAAGKLAWHIRDDLLHFKRVTMGKPIIMGRKTFDSIGRALPGRRNVVISTRGNLAVADIEVAASIDEALALARQAAQTGHGLSPDEICVIGGGTIYEALLPRADRLYLTQVHARIDGDVFFPEIHPQDWRIVKVGEVQQSDKNDHACSFFVMDRQVSRRVEVLDT